MACGDGARYGAAMAKDDPERERRLAEALRLNLRRRKAQERAVGETMPEQATPGAPAQAGAGEG